MRLRVLGRYIPGKVWSVAGLVVLAERAGVRRSAAAVSAFAMQAVVLGTGVVLVAIATPHAASPVLLGGAVVAALALIGVLAWLTWRNVRKKPLTTALVVVATTVAPTSLASQPSKSACVWIV